MGKANNICAVVVTYNPDSDFPKRLKILTDLVKLVIISDNSTTSEKQKSVAQFNAENISVISNSGNIGIASAFNIGIRSAIEEGYHWVLTMDQDSEASLELVDRLSAYVNTCTAPEKLAIVGSNILDRGDPEAGMRWIKASPRLPFLFKFTSCTEASDHSRLDNVSVVISSGSLLNASVFEKLGGYMDKLFIDYVDTEYCLRVLKNGYHISVVCNAILLHRLGKRKRVRRYGLVWRPTNHSPLRHYYISRNKIIMYRLYALSFPHWFFFDIGSTLYQVLRISVSEKQRLRKIKAAYLGLIDGTLGRTGKAQRRL